MPIGLSVLTIFMGNYFEKIEQNFVVGFRLPWTLLSHQNWKQMQLTGICHKRLTRQRTARTREKKNAELCNFRQARKFCARATIMPILLQPA